jgi:DNA polymerase-3 subunit delta
VQVLDAIRAELHDLGDLTHQAAHRLGQRPAAGLFGGVAVAFLVATHRFENRAAARILLGQLLQVLGQMVGHLPFGFVDEAEAPAIAAEAGERADRERAGVPQRLQLARRIVELAEAFFAPAQVIAFLARRVEQMAARVRVARGQRLAVIQRLRGDFAGVVDAHQAGDVTALVVGELAVALVAGRIGAAGVAIAFGEQRQAAAEQRQQRIDRSQFAIRAGVGGGRVRARAGGRVHADILAVAGIGGRSGRRGPVEWPPSPFLPSTSVIAITVVQLKASQLATHLAKGLAAIYLVAGEEPLLIQEALDAIRAAARKAGFSEREVLDVERGFGWHRVTDACASLSLFATRRIIEVRMAAGPDDEGRKTLQAIAQRAPQDVLLIIVCGALDKRQREAPWAKALDAAGAMLYVWPVKTEEFLPWIEARLKAVGVQADADAVKLLAERTEGNLLAAAQDVEKLKLLFPGERISAEALAQAVADSARFEAFDLNDRVLDGDAEGSVRSLQRLREEGFAPLEVLGALSWALRSLSKAAIHYARLRDAGAACEAAGIFRAQQAKYIRAVPRVRPAEALNWMRRAALVDQMVKTGQEAAAWEELLTLTLAASGAALRPSRS